ncbi:nitronate monooxygenase [Myroides marinus]|uniref:NAD(P)H-dependent flavin oxidoreductase n=1 Tax=Myroides marinus TaxID=703342 RepID=UPI0025775EE9|nr:nitronate monooxygenase [Myroides marinus]MDM1348788.1 nitronate monooxygenase [Myroides marinus]MDM1352483.1 nitronate monooxygenase [Myroides marinus]MDM1354953.1 nitronate monooxygenase [Myroides marinus]MDM1359688.1 nitronate monooxygenase [Myroides marinus]MDM1361765.1 nitronate monooxygenase [Myroides marinus]
MKKANDIFGIKYAICQAPMLGVATPEMVAAVSNTGCIGTLPLGGLPTSLNEQLILKTKSLTDKPFIVNLFLNPVVDINKEEIDNMQDELTNLGKQIGYIHQRIETFEQDGYTQNLELVKRLGLKYLAFTFGCFNDQEIEELHHHNIYLIGTATTVEEAVFLDNKGIDAILLQGIEAGGHRGSFLKDSLEDNLPLEDLFDRVFPLVNKPIFVAGGLYSGQIGKKYLDKGAAMICYGSLYIGSDESTAMDYQKELLNQGKPVETKLTKSFSGKFARGILNEYINYIDNSNNSIPYFPIQNILTQKLRSFAKQKKIHNFNSLWCGTNAHYARKESSFNITNKLIKEVYDL